MTEHRIRPTALRPAARTAAIAAAGLGLVGALAGCSTATTTTGTTTDDSGSSSSGKASYKDGSYAGLGDYQSPGGQESIDVKVTLKDDKVTEITVTPNASSGNAKVYQTAFASGISEKVVGKRIDELADVTKVSGSSLTSGGFQKAIEQIESLAKE